MIRPAGNGALPSEAGAGGRGVHAHSAEAVPRRAPARKAPAPKASEPAVAPVSREPVAIAATAEPARSLRTPMVLIGAVLVVAVAALLIVGRNSAGPHSD